MKIVVADIGGTHARFALASISPGRRPELGEMHRFRTREHVGLLSAWEAFRQEIGEELPRSAAKSIALAASLSVAGKRSIRSAEMGRPVM